MSIDAHLELTNSYNTYEDADKAASGSVVKKNIKISILQFRQSQKL